MYRTKNCRTYFSLFHKFSIKFNTLKNHTKVQVFLNNHENPTELTHTADKLKWYRFNNAVSQQTVADYTGLDRSTYIRYESGELDYYPIENLKSIAKLFNVNLTELLDDYNRFLYDGQGNQVRKLRKSMGLTQYQFGNLFNVSSSNVKRWESEKTRISKNTYTKMQLLHISD